MSQTTDTDTDDGDEPTTIGIRKATKKRFHQFGHAGQTHDEVLNDIMNQVISLQEEVAAKEERIRELEREE